MQSAAQPPPPVNADPTPPPRRKVPGLSVESAYRRLHALEARGIRLGLSRMHAALQALGNPHAHLTTVIVAGTNGKGSTAATIAAILQAAGLRTGLYTSPHLISPQERIAIDGQMLSAEAFVALAERILPLVDTLPEGRLTFFEALTCMAFLAFREAPTDAVVLEVGLGGRLDATNVTTPRVSVITPIGLDHTEYLGPTEADILREKAGVLRPGVPCVAGVAPELRERVLTPLCAAAGVPLVAVGRDVHYALHAGTLDYSGPRWQFAGLPLALPGVYQGGNAALALAAAEALAAQGLPLTERAVRAGLLATRWPGRFQVAETAPPFVLDVAHNPHGAEALAAALTAQFGPAVRFTVVLGLKADKDAAGILAALRPCAARFVLTGSPACGLTPAEALPGPAAGVPCTVLPELHAALHEALRAHAAGEAVLVSGSHVVVGAALQGGLLPGHGAHSQRAA